MLTKKQKTQVVETLQLGNSITDTCEITGFARRTVTAIKESRRRILVLSDLHCGHNAGLTPPDWWSNRPRLGKFNDQHRETYHWFKDTVSLLKPDIAIIPGDAIDGKGKRSGSSEQLVTTYKEQCDMALEAIKLTGAKQVVMVHGTPYHVGEDGEEHEEYIARKLQAEGIETHISGHEFVTINGINFDIKHKLGSSSIPHGRTTALNKEKLWNQLWSQRKQQPEADVIIRGHVHYHAYTGGPGWLGMTCPALQGWGSKYGVEQCSGLVDFGLIHMDVYDGSTVDDLQWRAHIPDLNCHHVEPVAL